MSAASRGLALQCSSYPEARVGGHGYSSLSVCYPRRVGGHGYSSRYPRRAWAATGIVVCLFVCLFVTGESAHLGAMALRLQHG